MQIKYRNSQSDSLFFINLVIKSVANDLYGLTANEIKIVEGEKDKP